MLEGTVAERGAGHLIVLVGGVGYRVAVAPEPLTTRSGTKIKLWIHTAVREDAIELYGFTSPAELALFELLISVSGIGPRKALAILAVSDGPSLRRAIGAGDLAHLTAVSGIGKKMAEKIILELREKLEGEGAPEGGSSGDGDVIAAIRSLGYTPEEARAAVRALPAKARGTNERIRVALQQLSRI